MSPVHIWSDTIYQSYIYIYIVYICMVSAAKRAEADVDDA